MKEILNMEKIKDMEIIIILMVKNMIGNLKK